MVVNIIKSLKTGCSIIYNDQTKLWIPFKHERLSNFCYSCGNINHTQTACTKGMRTSSTHLPEECGYGNWLWAKTSGTVKIHKEMSKENFSPATSLPDSAKLWQTQAATTFSDNSAKPLPHAIDQSMEAHLHRFALQDITNINLPPNNDTTSQSQTHSITPHHTSRPTPLKTLHQVLCNLYSFQPKTILIQAKPRPKPNYSAQTTSTPRPTP